MPKIKLHPKVYLLSALIPVFHARPSQGEMLNGEESSAMKGQRISNKPNMWERGIPWLSTSDSEERVTTPSNCSGECQVNSDRLVIVFETHARFHLRKACDFSGCDIEMMFLLKAGAMDINF